LAGTVVANLVTVLSPLKNAPEAAVDGVVAEVEGVAAVVVGVEVPQAAVPRASEPASEMTRRPVRTCYLSKETWEGVVDRLPWKCFDWYYVRGLRGD
jgi:hypothetical protein